MDTFSVSVVIPTMHRVSHVCALLTDLEKISGVSLEVIVVEQGTMHVEAYFETSPSFALTYVYVPFTNTAVAKNIGLSYCSHAYVLFLDDDIRLPAPEIVSILAGNFSSERVSAVCARIITKNQPQTPGDVHTGQITSLGVIHDGFSSVYKQYIDTVIGCAVLWNTAVIRELGGFDEFFNGNSLREETDLSIRARKKGYQLLIEPRASVYHDVAESGGNRKRDNRLAWYYSFFSNETYYHLKNFSNIFLTICYLSTKIEWCLRCMFGFGREISLRSMIYPWQGIADGIQKYIFLQSYGE